MSFSDKAKLAVAAVKGEETQDLYVAVTKATLAEEVVPKDKHVKTLKAACGPGAPPQQVDFVIYKLAKRLKHPSWVVALKVLMVFHRLMRECGAGFLWHMLRFCDQNSRHKLLCLDRFADRSTPEAWDYSSLVRAYSLLLDERLDAFRAMRFDPEAGQHGQQPQVPLNQGYNGHAGLSGPYGLSAAVTGSSTHPGAYGGGHGASYGVPGPQAGAGIAPPPAPPLAPAISLKDCSGADLLEHLPRVQRLMLRTVACVPEGAAKENALCLHAVAWVLRDSRAIYCAASEGIINLADKAFDMDRADSLRALELHCGAQILHEKLTAYYAAIQAVPALRGAGVTVPTLQPLPQDFLKELEEHCKGTGRDSPASPGRRQPIPTSGQVGRIAAIGSPTSAALSSGSPHSSEAPHAAPAPHSGTPQQHKQEPPAEVRRKPSSSVKEALLPDIDLLSFDAEPLAPAAAANKPAAAQPADPFGFLADAPVVPAPHAASAAAAPSSAFDPVAAGGGPSQQFAPQSHPPQLQQPVYYDSSAAGIQSPRPNMGPSPPPAAGGNPFGAGYAPQATGYMPQATGYGYAPQGPAFGYAPQMTGYGYAPQMTGANGMALVPAGGIPMNPFHVAPGGYGPPPPFGLPSPAAAGPTGGGAANPFADSPTPGGGGGVVKGRGLDGDPLNSLTNELLGALPSKAPAVARPQQPSLRQLKATGSPAGSPRGAGTA